LKPILIVKMEVVPSYLGQYFRYFFIATTLVITPSFQVYKAYTHIKIQTLLSLTYNLNINFLFL